MQRNRWLVLVGIVVVLLLVVGGAGYVLRSAPATEPARAEDDEQGASQVVAPTPPAAAPVRDIGRGGSAQGDWYQLYFTDPTYPDNPADHKGGRDEKLVALMDRAKTSLDVADYDFDLADVADAMVRAKGRGAVVRMVTDTDTLTNVENKEVQDAFGKLKKAGIPIVDDQRKPIMHNKFTVVDKEWVETGSWNYTDGDTYHLNNNMIVIHSKELAANYSAEFAKMFEKHQFGPTKDKAIPNPVVTIEGTRIENYFASEGNVADHIDAAIGRAKTSIEFLAFSFTSDRIGNAMLDRHRAGASLQGVFETTGSNTPFSEYTKMKKQGVDVYQDGNLWVMHHKVIIIDDHITIFGSFNFSDNADTQNDENVLIVDNPDIARAFKGEYDRVLALAKNPPGKKK